MITLTLAQQLKTAGLRWHPQEHHFFAVPDREMDERVFVISDMSVLVEVLQGWPAITFNGSVEWALDYVLEMEAVWLPTTDQLIPALGQAFVRLERRGEQFVCAIRWGEALSEYAAANSADACALALLSILNG
ncbi:MAG: pilus assembly protein CpaE [Anaerolineae bacterium]|nr:pilus assembly protein CpaE [Anaerolineae bacterium]